ncbi:MAG: hypothetical protein EOT04_02780 [Candidatus Chaera renei]|uniref:DUF916 domain-containing protein n=1 Tax=Candidatus Chaera renei TaxID=2506947 RepID=A0A4Q0AHS3_9BACT|nr:MAG: hypothetical protein EOT04_02780 [Candidatus Chaera renei]
MKRFNHRFFGLIRALAAVAAVLLLAAAVVGASSAAVSAQSQATPPQERITLSPTGKRYALPPGGSINDSLTVINDGDVPYDFVVYARPYTVIGEDYQPDFSRDVPGADAYQWVQFEASRYSLQPGQKVTVNYSVRIPLNASPGGHYGVIFAESQPASQPGENSIVRKKRVGSILYVTVTGAYRQGGSFLGAKLPFWQTRPPLSGYARVQNTGNVDFETNLKLRVSDVFGRTKYQNETVYSVLPATVRRLPLVWQDVPPIGLFKVSADIKFLDQNRTVNFWVLIMPRWVAALMVLVIGAAGIYYVLKLRRGN